MEDSIPADSGTFSSPPHFQQLYDLINSDLWTEYVVLCGQEPTSLIIQQRNLLAATIVRTFPIMQNLSLPVLLQEWIDAQIECFNTKPTSKVIPKPMSSLESLSSIGGKQDVSLRSSMLASRMSSATEPSPRDANTSNFGNIATSSSSATGLVPRPKKDKIAITPVTISSTTSAPSSSASAFSVPIEFKTTTEVKPKVSLQNISSTLSATSPPFASSIFSVPSSSVAKTPQFFPTQQFQSILDDKPKEAIQILSVRKKTENLQRQTSTEEPPQLVRSSSKAVDSMIVQTTQMDKSVQIANLVHLYSLNLIVFYDHTSFVAPFKASQKISLMSFASLLIKLQKVSKLQSLETLSKTRSNTTYLIDSMESLISLTKVLVEQLLSVVKGLGKAAIKSILSNNLLNNDSYWPVISILQDHLDVIGGSSEQNKSTGRLYSNMAESYVKPFSEEDNRNEQKSKEDKDLYKKRGEASDKFHNLFQTFKNLYSHDSAGIELLDFFRYDFVAQAQDILNMDARNLRWFSKIFIGTLIRNYLLMYEQHDGKEIKSSAEVMIKLPSSKGNNRSNGSSVTSDSSPIPSQSVVSTAPNMSAAPSSSSMSMSYFSENSSKMGYQPRNMDRSTGNARNTFTRNNRNQSGKMETTSRTIPAGFDFDGMMMFFSRFIYWLNNHRFNQALISVIMEEIHKLSSGSAHRLTADDSLLGHGGSVENLDTNSFTVSIMSLKILGRTLGLLHFHHFYEAFSPQDIAESGQWLNQTIIPFTEIIQQSVSKGRLCQVIPCIIEFLSMMKPIHSNLSSTQLMQNLNVFLGYTALCKLLFVIRWHPDFNLMSDGLSTNQLFVLLEIERLWGMMPHLYDCISSQASAQEHLPAKFLRSRSVPNSLDKANFALCDIALKLLTVELDQLLEKLPVTASSQTNVLTAKRKTENFTSANTSVIPLDRDKKQGKLTLQSVPASPASTASKSSMRSFNPMQAGITNKRATKTPNASFGAQHIHNSNDRLRFNASSGVTGTRQYPLSDLKMVSPFRYSSLSLSSTATLVESTSVVKKLFTENNQHAMTVVESYGQMEVLDADFPISDHQELLDKMDDSFWNYNKDLCDVHKFVLFYANVIGRERIQELVCSYIHKTSKFLDERLSSHASLLPTYSLAMVEGFFQKETEVVLQQAIKEGIKVLENMYDHFLHKQLKLLYSLYTKTTVRTVKLALWKTKFQLQLQKSFLFCHLKEYSSRKLFEVKDAKLRRYKDTEKVNNIAGPLDSFAEYRLGQFQPCNTPKPLKQMNALDGFMQTLINSFSNLQSNQILTEHIVIGERERESNFRLSVLSIGAPSSLSSSESKLTLLLQASVDIITSVVTMLAKQSSLVTTDLKEASVPNKLLAAFTTRPVATLIEWLSWSFAAAKEFVSNEKQEQLQSQVQVEIGKFLLSIFPYLLFADYTSLCQQYQEDDVATLYQRYYETGQGVLSLPSSCVHQLLESKCLLKSTLHKIAVMMMREKTANFYQHCKGLHPMAKFMKASMQLFYFELYRSAASGMLDSKLDGSWWQESGRRADFVKLMGAEHAEIVDSLFNVKNGTTTGLGVEN